MIKYEFLVPAYKIDFLENSIVSMLNQTYKEFCVTISDDCSPYDLKSIVDQYHDERIKYRRNEENIGSRNLVEHWNLLLSEARGEFVIMASDDDIYEPNFLEEMDKLITKYPNTDLFRCRVRNIDTKDEVIWEDSIYPEYQDEISAICSYSTVCVGNYVYRTSALKKIGGFFNIEYAMGSDTATAILMASKGMCNTSEILFNYRISDFQISHVSKSKKTDREKMLAALKYHEWLYNYIEGLEYPRTTLNEIKVRRLIQTHVLNGLKHTARLYYGSLNIEEVILLYKKMNKFGCFNRIIDKLVFMLDYFKSKKMYNTSNK